MRGPVILSITYSVQKYKMFFLCARFVACLINLPPHHDSGPSFQKRHIRF